jgi:membrane-bound inhibitor of C-type lysozyme
MAALGTLLLAAEALAEPAIRAQYRCGGSGIRPIEVTALFFPSEPRQVVLIEGTAANRLLQAPSGSGARYSDGQQEFWVRGQQAHWLRDLSNQKAPLHCTVATEAS